MGRVKKIVIVSSQVDKEMGVARSYPNPTDRTQVLVLSSDLLGQNRAFKAEALKTAIIGSAGATFTEPDRAALARPVGGIDLNSRNMNMDVSGEKIDLHFDKSTIVQFERGDFSGVKPVIIKITPIQNVMPLLGA
jgi:hypothetical protein